MPRWATFNIAAELGSTAAIKEAIKARVGASIVSDLAVAGDIAAGVMRVVRIREMGMLKRTFYRVLDPRRIASPVRDIFLDALAESGGRKRRRGSA